MAAPVTGSVRGEIRSVEACFAAARHRSSGLRCAGLVLRMNLSFQWTGPARLHQTGVAQRSIGSSSTVWS